MTLASALLLAASVSVPVFAQGQQARGGQGEAVLAPIDAKAIAAFTTSGASALRVARERPEAPVLGITPTVQTARRMALVWGVQIGRAHV